MKYALVNHTRAEAFSGGKGLCPSCQAEVIAKCGSFRIPHWAHRAIRDCDPWSEKETEWHRTWKNNFPADFQEYVQHDSNTGERHIADVRTDHGLVIEFQHSHLDEHERIARERFYGNMIWVVDGTRLQRDYPRFLKGKDGFRFGGIQGYFLLSFPEECFPKGWLNSSAPVIFDFQGSETSADVQRNTLWCLLPGRAGAYAVIVGISREQFVALAPTRAELIARNTVSNFAQVLAEQAQQKDRPLAGFTRPGRRASRF